MNSVSQVIIAVWFGNYKFGGLIFCWGGSLLPNSSRSDDLLGIIFIISPIREFWVKPWPFIDWFDKKQEKLQDETMIRLNSHQVITDILFNFHSITVSIKKKKKTNLDL